jgi:hypothetical protein
VPEGEQLRHTCDADGSSECHLPLANKKRESSSVEHLAGDVCAGKPIAEAMPLSSNDAFYFNERFAADGGWFALP